jgi:hypothetical protein
VTGINIYSVRYLKEYKIFESLSEVDVLSDICDDLRDDGYSVDIGQPYKNFKTIIDDNYISAKQNTIVVEVDWRGPVFDGVSIETDYTLRYFSFVKVKEVFDRMDKYMRSEGYNSELELCRQKYSGIQWVKFSGKITDKHKSYRIKFFKNEIPKDI